MPDNSTLLLSPLIGKQKLGTWLEKPGSLGIPPNPKVATYLLLS